MNELITNLIVDCLLFKGDLFDKLIGVLIYSGALLVIIATIAI